MRRLSGLVLAIGALAIIVFDLVTTTLEANRRKVELSATLASIPSPSEAKRVSSEVYTATRRATVRWVFETEKSPANLVSFYRSSLAAADWSECGLNRTGDLYTGDVVREYVWCRGENWSLAVSLDKVFDGTVRQYAVTAEWNTRHWWISVAGLVLGLTAILGLQICFRGFWQTSSVEAIVLWTELSPDECHRRLQELGDKAADGLVLVRIERSDSSRIRFELERSRSRWAQNALAPYVYGGLRPERGGTRVEVSLGFSPIAKITSAVIGLLLLGGFSAQVVMTPENALSNAVALLVAIVLIIMIAPLFWRRAKSRVVQVLTALLEIQVTT